MKRIDFLKLGLILVISILTINCVRNNNKNKQNAKLSVEPVNNSESAELNYFRFPAPEEIFNFIEESELTYKSNIVNTSAKHKQYETSDKQALNLGAYITDLAYLSVFQNQDYTYQYINAIHTLADNLEIDGAFSKDFINRVQSNINEIDSLVELSGDAYNKIVSYLEETGNERILALISVGTYIESLYLLMSYIDDYEEQSDLIQRIADQKYAFDNLYDFIMHNLNSQTKSETVNLIIDIKQIYDAMEQVESETEVTTSSNGQLVFGGGDVLILSEELFKKLKVVVNDKRALLIS